MTRRNALTFGGLLVIAFALTVFKVPLASSQGLTLMAAQVSGALPLDDPGASAWRSTTALEVPLSAQVVAKPYLAATTVKSVTARALHNGSQLAILVEWADATQNDSMVRVQDFRDSVAVQFPLVDGQPFFCMGQAGGNVNIWHWKADWQADIAARRDMFDLYPDMHVDQYPFAGGVEPALAAPGDYTDLSYLPALAAGNLFAAATRLTPVEDVIAGGFGSLTAQPADGQNVQGHGVWADGRWQVIFSRDLASSDPNDITFTTGQLYSIAFAAWDGANGERNGQKSTSQWVSLQVQGAPGPAAAAPSAARPFDTIAVLGIVVGVPIMLIGAGLTLAAAAWALSRLGRRAQ